MTNEEKKAREIVERFYQEAPETFGTGKAMHYAIKCALICVEEQINKLKELDERWHNSEYAVLTSFFTYEIEELETIKQIIEQL